MPAGLIRRATRHRANRRKNAQANRPQPTTPIGIVDVTPAGSVLTVVFDQPVSLKGVPQYTTDIAGADPISAALTAANTLALTFDASVAAAAEMSVPYEDAAIRNSSGGFVAPTALKV